MIVSVEQFDTYSGNYETAEDVVAMKTQMLMAAQKVVAKHLGFDPESKSYDDYVCGIGYAQLYLFAHPITEVDSVEISGVSLPTTSFTINDRCLRRNDGVWPVGIDNIHVSYTAGWSSETVPDIVKMTIIQIASLMLEESGGNIGITGKSFADNSRTFINNTNFDKWLSKLDDLVVKRMC